MDHSVTENEHRDIGARLENWARWDTAPGQSIASSQTGAICERLRRAELGDQAIPGDSRKVDEADAVLLDRCMRHLTTPHRLLPWYSYIKNADPEVVFRRKSIPVRPITEFVAIFRAAQAAIEKLTENDR